MYWFLLTRGPMSLIRYFACNKFEWDYMDTLFHFILQSLNISWIYSMYF